MSVICHSLGYPRIGNKRQTKFALEAYWAAKQDKATTQATLRAVLTQNIQHQLDAGLSVITVGDFSPYDAILSQAVALGIVPRRFGEAKKLDAFDRQFYYARGRDHTGKLPDTAAWQMTKWFDTNYHYLVPELAVKQDFSDTDFSQFFEQVMLAQQVLANANLEKPLKVVLIGPVSFLYLANSEATDKLTHLEALIPAYAKLLQQLGEAGVAWVQLDEPILSLDLEPRWQQAFEQAYHSLQRIPPKILVASYFDTLGNNCRVACDLPVAGIHIDVTRSQTPSAYVNQVIDHLPTHKVLSVGVVDGRSVWVTDQAQAQAILTPAYEKLGERLWVASGCSLLHLPVDITGEAVPSNLQGKLAFARQKLDDIAICAKLATGDGVADNQTTRLTFSPVITSANKRAGDFAERYAKQQAKLQLPLLPTTTIGSFPQTSDIRKSRHQWQQGLLTDADYQQAMQHQIQLAVAEQEQLGLDVLVHGEAERSDMVEYFAQYLDGFWLSNASWVQSYGTRCVRPPIVVGDISRPQAMTVEWIGYAQSLTDKPMKGMLTGPVTILNWSFAPSDTSSRDRLRLQIAEAINQEVQDLQQAGIHIIQIDEPAFREGLPLKTAQQTHYWQQAVQAFQHSCSLADETTQIHTHMCYSSFHDCLPHITAMDADVITIETARSGLQLLDAFDEQHYPNAIGPGVYDIHSPRTPTPANMQVVIEAATQYISLERLWVNPDCGLKTRHWDETRAALQNMVTMTQQLRERYSA